MEFRQHYLPSEAIEENSHSSIGLTSSYHWEVEPSFALVMGIDFEYTDGELTQTQQKDDTFGFGKARQQGIHYDYKVKANNIAPHDWLTATFFTHNLNNFSAIILTSFISD